MLHTQPRPRRGQPRREPPAVTEVWCVPCEVYSRIVGYLRPVQNWNKGKLAEWKERKTYDVSAV